MAVSSNILKRYLKGIRQNNTVFRQQYLLGDTVDDKSNTPVRILCTIKTNTGCYGKVFLVYKCVSLWINNLHVWYITCSFKIQFSHRGHFLIVNLVHTDKANKLSTLWRKHRILFGIIVLKSSICDCRSPIPAIFTHKDIIICNSSSGDILSWQVS